MKLSYAIENIRRLRTIPDIEIRPLTILVGRNSAGKSTFLRSFPLIRQSLETRSSAPVLWFGDLVDFGDLSSAIGDDADSKTVAFRFTFQNLHSNERPAFYSSHGYFWHQDPIQLDVASLRSVIGAHGDETVMQLMEIKIPTEHLEVQIDFRSYENVLGQIVVNGKSANFISKKYDIQATNRSLFSSPVFMARKAAQEGRPARPSSTRDVLAETLMSTFRRRATKRIGRATLWSEVQRVLSQDRLDKDALISLKNTAKTLTFRRIYSHLLSESSSGIKEETFAIHQLARAFGALDVMQEQLTEYFSNVNYLGPVRAASERFYRKQELEVSEIAPNGANFPMFLASLTAWELDQFSNWVKDIFGYAPIWRPHKYTFARQRQLCKCH